MNQITMQKDPLEADSQDRGEQVSVIKAKAIKLGIDIHARQYVVVRQIDHATPQPAQRFTPEEFLKWAEKQKQLGEKVYACYEAGCFGYGLYRKLTAMGIQCHVVCPQNWDERGSKVKNDQREQLLKERKRLQIQGRSLLCSQGIASAGRWWSALAWKKKSVQWPPWLVERLEVTRPILFMLEEKIKALTKRLEEATSSGQPRGFGAMTLEVLHREIGDWNRFNNRRQVASYTGLCPGQIASGNHHIALSVTKHGNPRVRHALVETAWRVVMFQPEYAPVKKWKPIIRNAKATAAARKKAVVAIGRCLAIDLWRMNTGRCTAKDLNLTLNP